MKIRALVVAGGLLGMAVSTQATLISTWTVEWQNLKVYGPDGGPDAVAYPFDESTIPFPSWGALTALVGGHWVVLSAGEPDSGPSLNWIGPDGAEYYFASATGLCVTHSLQATAGTAISGHALYSTYCQNDGIWPLTEEHGASSVTINGQTIWRESPVTMGPPLDDSGLRTLGMEDWSYRVPVDGTYTVSLNMWSKGCQYGESVFFDAIQTPDGGGTAVLMVGGLAAVVLGRRRFTHSDTCAIEE
ncbi:MAG: hypothetical protein IT581_08485 [Verrucomicrobiales bacterium]|nr:hypothetical protein [Verrucomicrobiales bacterium]